MTNLDEGAFFGRPDVNTNLTFESLSYTIAANATLVIEKYFQFFSVAGISGGAGISPTAQINGTGEIDLYQGLAVEIPERLALGNRFFNRVQIRNNSAAALTISMFFGFGKIYDNRVIIDATSGTLPVNSTPAITNVSVSDFSLAPLTATTLTTFISTTQQRRNGWIANSIFSLYAISISGAPGATNGLRINPGADLYIPDFMVSFQAYSANPYTNQTLTSYAQRL